MMRRWGAVAAVSYLCPTGVPFDASGWKTISPWYGFEYTTLRGQPRTYVNGAASYKVTSSSNVRLFVGEQRGAFRCASGICRFFPAFEGARLELTLRF